MLKKFSQNLVKHKITLLLLLAFFIYLVITLPALFDADHVMKNLEPYPDGMLFALGARNLSLGRGLKLVSNLGQVDFWVPPLYSLYLSIFYLFSKSIVTFYIANFILGLGTIFVIYLIIKKTTSNCLSLIAGLSIYFSHLIVFWLPSLAMTENLTLFLFSILVLGLVEKKELNKILLVFISILGLLLVRFSVLPIILFGVLILLYQLRDKILNYKKQLIYMTISCLVVLILLFKVGILSNLIRTIVGALFNPQFFNFSFVFLNAIYYVNSLLFSNGYFLWLPMGLSSWSTVLIFISILYILLKQRKYQKLIILVGLFLSLFPLQLFFYSVDARYIIYAIILFSLAGAWLVELSRKKKLVLGLLLISVLINVFYQRALLRQLIADNLLGRSTAWQYQAIKNFNSQLSDGDQIITALPPFLLDAYQTKNYQALPLSQTQEFLQKGMYVWGSDVNYDNLIEGYKQMLNEGNTLYFTNAYITHQQSVVADFEQFKSQFDMDLVKEGCDQACNIYKLKIKN